MGLFLPQRWRRQPLSLLGIDETNPLTVGLARAGYPINGVLWNSVTGIVGNWQGTPTVHTQVGVGFSTDGSSTYQSIPSVVTTSGGYTLATLASLNIRVGIAERLISLSATGGSAHANSTVGWIVPYDSAGNKLIQVGHAIVATGNLASAAVALPLIYQTGLHLYSASDNYTASGITAFADGINLGMGTVTAANGSIWTTQSNSLELGRTIVQDTVLWGQHLAIDLALHWTRILSPQEHAALAENPWQLFAPLSRRIISIPLGLAPSATGSAKDVGGGVTTAVGIPGSTGFGRAVGGGFTTAVGNSAVLGIGRAAAGGVAIAVGSKGNIQGSAKAVAGGVGKATGGTPPPVATVDHYIHGWPVTKAGSVIIRIMP